MQQIQNIRLLLAGLARQAMFLSKIGYVYLYKHCLLFTNDS
jgi:hypothetical protein